MSVDVVSQGAAKGVIEEFAELWQARSADAAIPSAQTINPCEIARLMPHLMLLEVVDGAEQAQFRARLVGSEHRNAVDAVHAGQILDEIDAEHARRARDAAETGKPVVWRAGVDEKLTIGNFPFAADGQKVDRVVSIVAGARKRARLMS